MQAETNLHCEPGSCLQVAWMEGQMNFYYLTVQSVSIFLCYITQRENWEEEEKKNSDGRKIKDKWLWPSVWNMKSISFLPLSPALCREMLQRMVTHPNHTSLIRVLSSLVKEMRRILYKYISFNTFWDFFFLRLNLWSHRSPWEPRKNWEHTFRLMLHADPYSFKCQLFLN